MDNIIIVRGTGTISPKTGDDGEGVPTCSYPDFYSLTVIFLRKGDTDLRKCLALCQEVNETKV